MFVAFLKYWDEIIPPYAFNCCFSNDVYFKIKQKGLRMMKMKRRELSVSKQFIPFQFKL